MRSMSVLFLRIPSHPLFDFHLSSFLVCLCLVRSSDQVHHDLQSLPDACISANHSPSTHQRRKDVTDFAHLCFAFCLWVLRIAQCTSASCNDDMATSKR